MRCFFPLHMLVSESSEDSKSAVRESLWLCLISNMHVNEMVPYVLLQDLFPIKLCRLHLISLPSFNSLITCIVSVFLCGQWSNHLAYIFPIREIEFITESTSVLFMRNTLATSPCFFPFLFLVYWFLDLVSGICPSPFPLTTDFFLQKDI